MVRAGVGGRRIGAHRGPGTGSKAPSEDNDSPTSVLDEAEAAQQQQAGGKAQDLLAFDEHPGQWDPAIHPDQDQLSGPVQGPGQRPLANQSCLPWGMPVKDRKPLLIV